MPGLFLFLFFNSKCGQQRGLCVQKRSTRHIVTSEVYHQDQLMSIHALCKTKYALDRHLCLDVTHPANQTRAHLAEELQVKVPDARVELTSFEKVINHIPWRERRQRNKRIYFIQFYFNKTTVKINKLVTTQMWKLLPLLPEFPPSASSVGLAWRERTYR